MLKLQPHEHEICGISNCTGVSWNAQSEVFLRNGCGPAQECLSIPLEEVGEAAIGEMFSISLLKYANPETQRIGCRIETLTDYFPASDLKGT